MTKYLDVKTVLKIHDAVAEGVVDNLNVIEGAVFRPTHRFEGNDLIPSIWGKAAALLHGLASTQGFSDGNKRTGWQASLTFLEANGWEVERVSDVDGTIVGLAASIPQMEVRELEEWFQQHTRPIFQAADNVPDGLWQTPMGWTKGNPVTAPTVEVDGMIVRPDRQPGGRTTFFGVRPALRPGNADVVGESQEIELIGGFSLPTEAFIPTFAGILADMGVRVQQEKPTMQFAPPATSTDGPARNAPCACGSGKKYKKCHGLVAAG